MVFGPIDERAALEFPLRGGGAIRLDAEGVIHPGAFLRRPLRTPYRDITHLAVSPRALRLGSRRSVYAYARRAFERPDDAARLLRRIVERIRGLPGGDEQLVRIAQVEVRAQSPIPLRAGLIAVVACIVVYALQWIPEPSVEMEGIFRRSHVDFGETWRIVTANLLHGHPLHLLLNALGLLGLGALVEWPVGTARTTLILFASAFAAMGAGYLAGYEAALGASGMVAGLAGAALYLELFACERLPVGWRVPRRLFLGLLGLQALFELATALTVPFIASAAHAGGFAAGFATAAVTVAGAPQRRRAPRVVLAANLVCAALAAISIVSGARALFGSEELLARRARGLLAIDYESPEVLNYTAWVLVTACDSLTPEQVEMGVELARRAVEATERRNPSILDTLAEAQFVAGRAREAVATIDEAIALAPNIPYFHEQRRRFTGERDPDDRPGLRDLVPLPPGRRPPEPEPVVTAFADRFFPGRALR